MGKLKGLDAVMVSTGGATPYIEKHRVNCAVNDINNEFNTSS